MILSIILIFVSQTHQKDHNNSLFTLHIAEFNSTFHYSLWPISFELFVREALDSHQNISPEANPVVELNFAPFVRLIDEIDDNTALICLQNKQIHILDVASADCQFFESKAVLQIAFAVVCSRSRQGVAIEVIRHGVVGNIR